MLLNDEISACARIYFVSNKYSITDDEVKNEGFQAATSWFLQGGVQKDKCSVTCNLLAVKSLGIDCAFQSFLTKFRYLWNNLINGCYFQHNMDDMTRIPPQHCAKVFIQRDYSEGTAVRFQNKFPSELEGKVTDVYVLYLILYFCWRKK